MLDIAPIVVEESCTNEKKEELATLLAQHSKQPSQYYYISTLSITQDCALARWRVHMQEIRVCAKDLKVPVFDPSRGRNLAREVHWTPKSYESRIIPIEPRLQPLLEELQAKRSDTIFGLYFLSKRGNQITDHISRPIKKLTGKTDVSAHTFRHTHISHALNWSGRNPSVVQRWVGHKDLKTTMQYVHVSIDDLHREALKMRP